VGSGNSVPCPISTAIGATSAVKRPEKHTEAPKLLLQDGSVGECMPRASSHLRAHQYDKPGIYVKCAFGFAAKASVAQCLL
jgi:hypothetical protein